MSEKNNKFRKDKFLIYFTLFKNLRFLVIAFLLIHLLCAATHGLNTKYLPEIGFFTLICQYFTKKMKEYSGFFPHSSFP